MKTDQEITALLQTIRDVSEGKSDLVTLDAEYAFRSAEAVLTVKWRAYCGAHGHSEYADTPESAVGSFFSKLPQSLHAKVNEMRLEADRLEAIAQRLKAGAPANEAPASEAPPAGLVPATYNP